MFRPLARNLRVAPAIWLDVIDRGLTAPDLPRLVPLVGAVHQQARTFLQRPQAAQQLAAFRRVVRAAGRQRERHGRASVRGNPMNLGVPSPSGLADALWTVFFARPSRPDAL